MIRHDLRLCDPRASWPAVRRGRTAHHLRVPNAAHRAHPWVIGGLAPEFTLLDVWRLPAEGGVNDFDGLVEIVPSLDPFAVGSAATRALFRLRYELGSWLGWDDAEVPMGGERSDHATLRSRLPVALRDTATDERVAVPGFVALYRTDDEWAAEISNRTVHGVLHLAWVDEGYGRYHGEMAVYVKPRGALGTAYLAVITPFRHLIVYPALMREIGQAWEARTAAH